MDTNEKGIGKERRQEFQVDMSQNKNRQTQRDEVRGAIKEIKTLKQEVLEITRLIKGVIKK